MSEAYFFNTHKNVEDGSGSVINWPPGSRSVIQDYGIWQRNIYGSTILVLALLSVSRTEGDL
jgi:hypothetical protein